MLKKSFSLGEVSVTALYQMHVDQYYGNAKPFFSSVFPTSSLLGSKSNITTLGKGKVEAIICPSSYKTGSKAKSKTAIQRCLAKLQ